MCNHIPPANGGRRGERFASPERKCTTPPRYHPQIWRDVGAGFLKALLDAEGASVWSRLPQSKFRSLEKVSIGRTNERPAEIIELVGGGKTCLNKASVQLYGDVHTANCFRRDQG